MSSIIKTIFISALLIAGLQMGLTTSAQETPAVNEAVENAVNLDENIQAQDLGVKEPRILPDNPFYFLKSWTRTVQSFLTFGPTQKAELKSKFANEKLMEVKKMVEENKNPEAIKKATESYQKEVEGIKTATEKIKETAAESSQVDNFLNKFVQQQILHQKLLDKLETQVPPEVFEKIQEAREAHLEKFGEVMTKLENRPEKIKEKLGAALEIQTGSEFKDFKNLEVLKRVEEKVPEVAKDAIKEVEAKITEKLGEKLSSSTTQKQEEFQTYAVSIYGDKAKQLEVLENLKLEVRSSNAVQAIAEAKTEILNRESLKSGVICPTITIDLSFCAEGRTVYKKDNNGCIIGFDCVVPSDPCTEVCKYVGSKSEGWYDSCSKKLIKWAKCGISSPTEPGSPSSPACTNIWDPVCGTNGKTYSNKCFAKAAGVEIAYDGECAKKECGTDSDCPQPTCSASIETGFTTCKWLKSVCEEGKCVLKERPDVCPALWNPVCGTNGKTYANDCAARLAGVGIAYRGECKVKECSVNSDCPQVACICKEGSLCNCPQFECVDGKCVMVQPKEECKIDSDCPQPLCLESQEAAPLCMGIKAKCINGKCTTVNQESCAEKCKVKGFVYPGTCRSWPVVPGVEWGCKTNEVDIGQTPDCTTESCNQETGICATLLGASKTCCCLK